MLTAHGPQVGHSNGAHAHTHGHGSHGHGSHGHEPHPSAFHPPEFHAHVVFPPMPEIGLSEARYTRLEREAEAAGDHHAREAWKVAQYVTLSLDPHLKWEKKLRYFQHALHHHCVCPPLPDDATWAFYHDLMSLVRDHAGAEALRLASAEDEVYAKWLAMGCGRDRIESAAEEFFYTLMGKCEKCPEHFHEEDWEALKVFRNQWV